MNAPALLLMLATQMSSGAEAVSKHCTACHGPSLIAQQRLDRAGWTRELDKMIRWGARVPDAERPTLIDFLVATFPASSGPPNSARFLVDGAGSDTARTACLGCHDARRIADGASREAWTAVVDRMIARGAYVPPARKRELIEYLATDFNRQSR